MDFVKEGKLDDERKRRQAEWERVRQKDDPIEAPPEVFDNRTLYDKLKEQHEIKKKEFEDQYSLKNQIRGVDVDEASFLSEIDRVRMAKEREIRLEEKKEVEEVKKALSSGTITQTAPISKITVHLPSSKKENKQAELLSHAIVTKRKITATESTNTSTTSNTTTTTTTTASSTANTTVEKTNNTSQAKNDVKSNTNDKESDSDDNQSNSNNPKKARDSRSTELKIPSAQIVVGILPGVGAYDSDSSSQSDSSSDDDDVDINRSSSSNSAASKLM